MIQVSHFDSATRPRGLNPGDKVAVVAPASQIKEGQAKSLEKGLDWLRAQGWEPVMMPHADCRHDKLPYLAGEDEARVADLHAAFTDPEIKAIWCLRGGYGTPRLLRFLDLEIVRANPKIFVGYSDITALHLPINQRTGLITFHGGMIASNLAVDEWRDSEWAVESLLRCIVSGKGAPGALSQGREEFMGRTIVEGEAEGTTIGGNLALITGLHGTPHGMDDSAGRILLLEDIGESPYQVDRLLTQLRLSMKFDQVSGIALGQFSGMEGDEVQVLADLFEDRLGDLGKPVVMGLPFGHDQPCGCVPLGAEGRLIAGADGKGDLVFDMPVVR